MRLVIDIITRGQDDYLAVACPEGALLSDAGVGGSTTERHAVQQAINAYYTNVDMRERAAHPPLILDPEPPVLGLVPDPLGDPRIDRKARVAVDSENIRALLEDACRLEATVKIDGVRVGGEPYRDRLVEPKHIYTQGLFEDKSYVVVRDVASDESRTFRLDGIHRAEIVS